jgi:ATP-binding cassette subfamily B protein
MVILVGGLWALSRHKFDVATFLLFQVYIMRIIDNVRRSTMIVRQLEVVAGDAQEMTELLEQPPLVQDKPVTEKSRIAKGSIAFDAMTFQYDDANMAETLFENFNLDIKPGEKVGLVGPSGGGKTTITRLLLRFMDIQDGYIKIDGQDIRDIKQQDLRRAIAYVPQEPLLFHRSIKDNIRYGRPSAGDDEVIAVAKKAFAHDFIKTLPQGYDTLVGERGVKLSGGQRQRVAIARAMLKNAPILILDEATSALDSESEQLIQKALWELMKDKTAVVIAHRLSTIQRMDRIVVLDEGRIIEQGAHQTLLKHKGLYARLWRHQSGGFLEE